MINKQILHNNQACEQRLQLSVKTIKLPDHHPATRVRKQIRKQQRIQVRTYAIIVNIYLSIVTKCSSKITLNIVIKHVQIKTSTAQNVSKLDESHCPKFPNPT